MSLANLLVANDYTLYIGTAIISNLKTQRITLTDISQQITLGSPGHITIIDSLPPTGTQQIIQIPDTGVAMTNFLTEDNLLGFENINVELRFTLPSNQIIFGAPAHQTIINSAAPSGALQTLTIPDSGQLTSNFILRDYPGLQYINSNLLLSQTADQLFLGPYGSGAALNMPPLIQREVFNFYDIGSYNINDTTIRLGIVQNVTLPAAGNTNIQADFSGITYFLPTATADNVITLQDVSVAGQSYIFIASAPLDGVHTNTITAQDGAVIYGLQYAMGVGPQNFGPVTNIIQGPLLVAIGDTFSIMSNGTNWIVNAISANASWSFLIIIFVNYKMSYIGIDPEEDIRPFVEVKPESSYPQSVKKEVDLLSLRTGSPAIPFGSYIYRIQKYPGDIDLIEQYQIIKHLTKKQFESGKYGTKKELNIKINKELGRRLAGNLQFVIDEIEHKKLHYFSELKAGLDIRFEIPIGNINNGSYYPDQNLLKKSKSLFDQKLITPKEFKIIRKLLKKKRPLNGDDFDTIFYIFREHRILRWSYPEVLKGYKMLPGKIKVPLEIAVIQDSHVKIDEIVLLNGRFVEVTNFIVKLYTLQPYDPDVELERRLEKKHKYLDYIINFDENYKDIKSVKTEIHTIHGSLLDEIEKLYFSNMYYSPFKMVKRMYSLARQEKNNDILLKLIPIISSNISLMYQIESELDTINSMLYGLRNVRKAIDTQLDEMKARIANIIEFNQDQVMGINKLLDDAISTTSKVQKIEITDKLIKILKRIIIEETIVYLNSVGLNPPPNSFLPKHRIYEDIIREPGDVPENPLKVALKQGGNIYTNNSMVRQQAIGGSLIEDQYYEKVKQEAIDEWLKRNYGEYSRPPLTNEEEYEIDPRVRLYEMEKQKAIDDYLKLTEGEYKHHPFTPEEKYLRTREEKLQKKKKKLFKKQQKALSKKRLAEFNKINAERKNKGLPPVYDKYAYLHAEESSSEEESSEESSSDDDYIAPKGKKSLKLKPGAPPPLDYNNEIVGNEEYGNDEVFTEPRTGRSPLEDEDIYEAYSSSEEEEEERQQEREDEEEDLRRFNEIANNEESEDEEEEIDEKWGENKAYLPKNDLLEQTAGLNSTPEERELLSHYLDTGNEEYLNQYYNIYNQRYLATREKPTLSPDEYEDVLEDIEINEPGLTPQQYEDDIDDIDIKEPIAHSITRSLEEPSYDVEEDIGDVEEDIGEVKDDIQDVLEEKGYTAKLARNIINQKTREAKSLRLSPEEFLENLEELLEDLQKVKGKGYDPFVDGPSLKARIRSNFQRRQKYTPVKHKYTPEEKYYDINTKNN